MYIEKTVTSVERTPKFTILEIGKYLAKPPLECQLEVGNRVQISLDTYTKTLLHIASEICSGCPLKGNTCRYGIDGFISKPQ